MNAHQETEELSSRVGVHGTGLGNLVTKTRFRAFVVQKAQENSLFVPLVPLCGCPPCVAGGENESHPLCLPGEDLFGGVARNYQLFEPLDFLAELTQHIPDKGEHPIRYYGCYSNKSRGRRAKCAAACPPAPGVRSDPDAPERPAIAKPARPDRRRWAALIKHVYQADPLRCPQCGGSMKIIAFIEACQGDTLRKILEHCGLWRGPPTRGPPRPSSPPGVVRPSPVPEPRITHEVDPDFLEHRRREVIDQPLTRDAALPLLNAMRSSRVKGQPELPWEP